MSSTWLDLVSKVKQFEKQQANLPLTIRRNCIPQSEERKVKPNNITDLGDDIVNITDRTITSSGGFNQIAFNITISANGKIETTPMTDNKLTNNAGAMSPNKEMQYLSPELGQKLATLLCVPNEKLYNLARAAERGEKREYTSFTHLEKEYQNYLVKVETEIASVKEMMSEIGIATKPTASAMEDFGRSSKEKLANHFDTVLGNPNIQPSQYIAIDLGKRGAIDFVPDQTLTFDGNQWQPTSIDQEPKLPLSAFKPILSLEAGGRTFTWDDGQRRWNERIAKTMSSNEAPLPKTIQNDDYMIIEKTPPPMQSTGSDNEFTKKLDQMMDRVKKIEAQGIRNLDEKPWVDKNGKAHWDKLSQMIDGEEKAQVINNSFAVDPNLFGEDLSSRFSNTPSIKIETPDGSPLIDFLQVMSNRMRDLEEKVKQEPNRIAQDVHRKHFEEVVGAGEWREEELEQFFDIFDEELKNAKTTNNGTQIIPTETSIEAAEEKPAAPSSNPLWTLLLAAAGAGVSHLSKEIMPSASITKEKNVSI